MTPNFRYLLHLLFGIGYRVDKDIERFKDILRKRYPQLKTVQDASRVYKDLQNLLIHNFPEYSIPTLMGYYYVKHREGTMSLKFLGECSIPLIASFFRVLYERGMLERYAFILHELESWGLESEKLEEVLSVKEVQETYHTDNQLHT